MEQRTIKTPRHASIELIENLHEDAGYDEIMYRLYVLSKINKGIGQHKEGKVFTHEEVKKRLTREENNMV